MIEFENLDRVIISFAFLSPGFLILFGRSKFLTGRIKSVAAGIFEYVMVSSVYYAVAFPIFLILEEPTYLHFLLLLFAAPLAIGLILGFASQKKYFRQFANLLGLNPVHHTPTGWDYAFGGRTGLYWVVVSLNSGGRYYGVWGGDSLASSDLNKRDLYIEDVRTNDFQPIEKDGRKRSVWISETDIRSVELIEDRKNE